MDRAIPGLELITEFARVAEALRGKRLRYALVGGLAMAVHGFARATKDIDFLVHPEDLDRVRRALATAGFRVRSEVMTFNATGITLHRLIKTYTDTEDYFLVDLMVPLRPAHLEMIQRARRMKWSNGFIRVLRREDLIDLKRDAGRPQDLADIQRLSNEANKTEPA
ncbi:MAG TPA: nucleotidyltransferase family protein [Kiritimatiellia bacterium]|nr:nucleotidyltransferase family protein [Kiritimatiellia bacterium]